jgi:undecaprenyl phosphate-alpha-L-ara4FN deformylase
MSSQRIRLGLRVDVDTLRGTRLGVPGLVETLGDVGARASFFFSVGPDNMGRNLYRLLRPKFLMKMLRSGAPSLYGWDILLMGTLGPGPIIGLKAREQIRAAAAAGHEIGLHAWDHYTWQNFLERMSAEQFGREFARAYESLGEITGAAPVASANPAWRSTPAVVEMKERYPFKYNSDCRGPRMFLPMIGDSRGRIPQVPVTLPTFDEIIGREGITAENFNRSILDRLVPDGLNVYTIHAEVEGIAYRQLFREFMKDCRARAVEIVPLGELVPDGAGLASLPAFAMIEGEIPGREGRVAMAVEK